KKKKKNNKKKTLFSSISSRDSFKRKNSKRAAVIPNQAYGTHRSERSESEYDLLTRNKRSVWQVSTKPYKGAHFATFPMDL
ncbi:site-specific DNA-methyltransferase, partial [Acinetobacter baumannii]|nr:site-specific DNA-methyltransferase [Acinetobacter baumannii]